MSKSNLWRIETETGNTYYVFTPEHIVSDIGFVEHLQDSDWAEKFIEDMPHGNLFFRRGMLKTDSIISFELESKNVDQADLVM